MQVSPYADFQIWCRLGCAAQSIYSIDYCRQMIYKMAYYPECAAGDSYLSKNTYRAVATR